MCLLERGFRFPKCCLCLKSSMCTVCDVQWQVFLVWVLLRLNLAILQGEGCLRIPIGTTHVILLEPWELDKDLILVSSIWCLHACLIS
jgi:hypothetical protein